MEMESKIFSPEATFSEDLNQSKSLTEESTSDILTLVPTENQNDKILEVPQEEEKTDWRRKKSNSENEDNDDHGHSKQINKRGGRGRPQPIVFEHSRDNQDDEIRKERRDSGERNHQPSIPEETNPDYEQPAPRHYRQPQDDKDDWSNLVVEEVNAKDLKTNSGILPVTKKEVISRSVSRNRVDRRDGYMNSNGYQNRDQNFRGRSRTPTRYGENNHREKDDFWKGYENQEEEGNQRYGTDRWRGDNRSNYGDRGGRRGGRGARGYNNRYGGERDYRNRDSDWGYQQRPYRDRGDGYGGNSNNFGGLPDEGWTGQTTNNTESVQTDDGYVARRSRNNDRSRSAMRGPYEDRGERSRTPTRGYDRSRSAMRSDNRSTTPGRNRSRTPGFTGNTDALDAKYGYVKENPEVYYADFSSYNKPAPKNYYNQDESESWNQYGGNRSSRGGYGYGNSYNNDSYGRNNRYNQDQYNQGYYGKTEGWGRPHNSNRGGYYRDDQRSNYSRNNQNSYNQNSERYPNSYSSRSEWNSAPRGARGGSGSGSTRGRPLHEFNSGKGSRDNEQRPNHREDTHQPAIPDSRAREPEKEMTEEKQPTIDEDRPTHTHNRRHTSREEKDDSRRAEREGSQNSRTFKEVYGDNCKEIDLNWDNETSYKQTKRAYKPVERTTREGEYGEYGQQRQPKDYDSNKSASRGRHKLNETHSNFHYMGDQSSSRNYDDDSRYNKPWSGQRNDDRGPKRRGNVADFFIDTKEEYPHQPKSYDAPKEFIDSAPPNLDDDEDRNGRAGKGNNINITFGKEESFNADPGQNEGPVKGSFLSKEVRMPSNFDRFPDAPPMSTRGGFSGGNLGSVRGRRGR